jgi:AcrR family transcriptional regulator
MATNRRKPVGPSREDQTRSEIIAAAKRLAQRHGLRKVTMDEIAGALGKKKSFLYYYYPGKREVIEAAVRSELTEMQQRVRHAVSQRTGAAERLRAFILTRLETVIKEVSASGPGTVTSALQGPESVTGIVSLVQLRQSFDRQEERFVAGLIREGIDEGAFRPLPPRVIDDVTYFLLSAMRGVELELAISLSLSSKPAPSLGPRMTRVLDVLLKGLAM